MKSTKLSIITDTIKKNDKQLERVMYTKKAWNDVLFTLHVMSFCLTRSLH